ncbi:MAG: class I SAM-dependent methyltransferase [Actinomycetota bacterium]|nr:class I SAM-dependent methyltransferase [Actinomycetota bacterium]
MTVLPATDALLRTRDGDLLPFEPSRWGERADHDERALLADVDGPVLDVGCGPGRLVHHLVLAGVTAMGVDPAPGAVALARQRGAPVLQRGIWEHLPGEGRWGTVLLFDGNVGIGGDPVALLRRCGELLGPRGRVLAELEAPGAPSRRLEARIERGAEATPWFPWATLGVADAGTVAARAGLEIVQMWHTGGAERSQRWFVLFGAPGGGGQRCAVNPILADALRADREPVLSLRAARMASPPLEGGTSGVS